jgi:hypothetical protein
VAATARVFRGAIRQAARADVVGAILARRILHVGPEDRAAAVGILHHSRGVSDWLYMDHTGCHQLNVF